MLVYITMLTCLLQDFVYTALMAAFFLIASIVFASDNGGTDLENAAVVNEHLHSDCPHTSGSWLLFFQMKAKYQPKPSWV